VKFFLSYTTDTKPVADRLVAELPDQAMLLRHEPAMASDAFAATLRQADAFVFLIGEERGPWVEREWSQLIEESWSHPGKKLIPVLLGSAISPAFLLDRVPIRIKDPVAEWDDFLAKLLRALGNNAKVGERRGSSPELRKQSKERMKTLEA